MVKQLSIAVLLISCLFFGHTHAKTVVDDASLADQTNGENWLGYGRTYDEQRYSPLNMINDANVKDLGVEWYLDLPNDRSLTGTPLAVDGVLYFNGSYNVVRAVDAKSGKVLWTYDPQVIEHAGERLKILWDWLLTCKNHNFLFAKNHDHVRQLVSKKPYLAKFKNTVS